MEQKFNEIVSAFDDMKPDVEGFEPELVIVFETIADDIKEFSKAAANVEGLEWVGELDLGDQASDNDFHIDKEGSEDKPLTARLYAVMSNQKAAQSLLSLWNNWLLEPDKTAARGLGPFKNIFQHLKDIRRWGPLDRLTGTGVLEDWRANLQFDAETNQPPVRFEVELWYRDVDATRTNAYTHLEDIIKNAGGRCIAQSAIRDICYHGVLAELPADAVADTLSAIQSQEYTELLRCKDVMFFRPCSQSLHPLCELSEEKNPVSAAPGALVVTSPVIAVLDGLPLENHTLIRDHLIVDDPDQFSQHYTQPGHQQHGTAMCSLIVNGDLNKNEQRLSQKIYVRPIFVPLTDWNGQYRDEGTPEEILLIDLVHRAIRRIVDADGNEQAAAPNVKVINLSFGNRWQPFENRYSPLARLLDWLAWKYKLLFIISVGNHGREIMINTAADQWKNLSPDQLRNEVIQAIRNDQVARRPLSPAESVNAITVGAWHEDASTTLQGNAVDLYKDSSLPSPFCTVAAGYAQAVKPEVYFPGGRQLYRGPTIEDVNPTKFTPVTTNRPPGLKVAAPGTNSGELTTVSHGRGTSHATALATHSVGLAYERLLEYRNQPGWDRLTDEYLAVILKTLLVHGASWGNEAEMIEAALPPDGLKGKNGNRNWQHLQRILNRFIGCGKVDPLKAQSATDQRATVLAWDSLADGKSHVYSLPLPPSLSGRKVKRKVSVTLAWLSPINVRHRNYRQAFLWTDIAGKEKLQLEKAGLDQKTSQRGTVQHLVWESEKIVVIPDDERIEIRVNCKADAGKMSDSIPYGLAISLEVAEGLDIPIYEEVRERISIQISPLPNPL
ncbi:MAG: S8 family peptidase [Zavarzinella sp.]